MAKKLIFTLIFFVRILSACFCQNPGSFDARAKTKALFMYGFTKYFVWPDENLKGDFRIGVYGASDNLIVELKKLANLKKVNDRSISIINLDDYSDVKKMPSVHMFYVDVEKHSDFKIEDVSKGALVITESENNNKNFAIGFRFIDEKLKFGFNGKNVEKHGLEYYEGFEKLAFEVYSKGKYYDGSKKEVKRTIEQNANVGRNENTAPAITPLTSTIVQNEYQPGFDAVAKTKAMFIYGFTKYFDWSTESKKGDFVIGFIGKNEALKFELEKLASIKKINDQTINIVDIDPNIDIQKMPPTQVLYYDVSVLKSIDLKKIPKNTLLISDNENNYNKAVISFMYLDSKLKFAYNKFLAQQMGLITKEEFKALSALNYEPTAKEKLELLNGIVTKRSEEIAVKPNEVKTTNSISEVIDNSVKTSSIASIALSKSKIIAAKTEWENVLEKIKGNLDEVTLSKDEVQQISGKLIKQEKDIEAQQMQIDFQMTNIEIQKELMEHQEKNIKEKEIKLLKQESEIIIQMDKINTQRTIIWLSLAAILSVIFGLYMLFQNYNKSKKTNALLEKQKSEIQSQKHLIEEKQHEILDSINYAQRIQRALLASKYLFDNNLKDYFIFFKPKDVVSGDFYWAASSHWLDERGSAAGSVFYLCTADSTGHGVPGSIMSMLNISCLEKAVEVEKLTEPKDILNHARTKIIEALKRDGSEQGGKDGMDCSLIALDFKNLKMVYAAANNPIWIIRKKSVTEPIEVASALSINSGAGSANSFDCLELSPDKMPVGKHDKDMHSFTQHEISLKRGDVIYTFTDGLPDQFGGPKGKKFMYKKMKELLIAISHLPMQEQQIKLETALNDWMGQNEQVDDITLIGIRV